MQFKFYLMIAFIITELCDLCNQYSDIDIDDIAIDIDIEVDIDVNVKCRYRYINETDR